ncbi:MAG: hypothetical protein ACM33B_02415 [Pseudomonadota bacterium]
MSGDARVLGDVRPHGRRPADAAGETAPKVQPSRARHVLAVGTFGVAVVTAAVTWSQVVEHLHAPEPVAVKGTPAAIVWSDRVFRSEAEFAAYLRRRDIPYEQWASAHPAAVKILRSRDRAAAAQRASAPAEATADGDAGASLATTLEVATIGGALVLLAGAAAALTAPGVARRRPSREPLEVPPSPAPAERVIVVGEDEAGPPARSQAPAERTVVGTCEIRWWRGYVKSRFCAVSTGADGAEAAIAESPLFAWRQETPPPQTAAAQEALETLVAELDRDGWTVVGRGDAWFALRLEAGATD